MSKKTMKGFTLIELVIVIAVIAILAAILVPTILNQADRARVSRARSEVGELARAMARMRTDVGLANFYNGNCAKLANLNKLSAAAGDCGAPATLKNCSQLTTQEAGQQCWGGPYTPQDMSDSKNVDPWNKAYALDTSQVGSAADKSNAIMLFSYGPDQTIDTNPAAAPYACNNAADSTGAAGGDDICAIQ